MVTRGRFSTAETHSSAMRAESGATQFRGQPAVTVVEAAHQRAMAIQHNGDHGSSNLSGQHEKPTSSGANQQWRKRPMEETWAPAVQLGGGGNSGRWSAWHGGSAETGHPKRLDKGGLTQ